jgi:hypothetical protein
VSNLLVEDALIFWPYSGRYEKPAKAKPQPPARPPRRAAVRRRCDNVVSILSLFSFLAILICPQIAIQKIEFQPASPHIKHSNEIGYENVGNRTGQKISPLDGGTVPVLNVFPI